MLSDLQLGAAAELLTVEVQVHYPRVSTVQYQWNGKEIKYQMFQCLLATGKPGDYVAAEAKATKKQPQLPDVYAKRLPEKTVVKMSAIKFVDAKLQYVHTPVKKVVNLVGTTLQTVAEERSWPAVPTVSLGECVALQAAQLFDCKGYVTEVGSVRQVSNGRQVFDITLEDGSKSLLEGKHVAIKISLWSNTSSTDPAELATAKRCHANRTPLFLYAVGGKQDSAHGYVIQSSRQTLVTPAPDGFSMEADYDEIAACPAEAKQTLQADYSLVSEDKSYTEDWALNATVILMQKLHEDSKTNDLLWQVNWCELTLAKGGQDMVNKSGLIWLRASLRDMTGHAEVWMREKAVLDLMGGCSRSEFLDSVASGQQPRFPLVCSVRVLSRMTTDQESSLVVVEGCAQNVKEQMNSTDLVHLVRACPSTTSQVLPCKLEDLGSNALYNLCCRVGQETIGCQRALCLITTSKSSKLEQVAEGRGFVVTTEKVQCALQPDMQPNAYYQAKSMCTLQNSIHMRLDPQPGETQMALVSIAGKTGQTILVHDVRLIRSDEVTEVKNSMERLVQLAIDISKAADFRGNRHVVWTPDNAKKCRRLSRSPTET